MKYIYILLIFFISYSCEVLDTNIIKEDKGNGRIEVYQKPDKIFLNTGKYIFNYQFIYIYPDDYLFLKLYPENNKEFFKINKSYTIINDEKIFLKTYDQVIKERKIKLPKTFDYKNLVGIEYEDFKLIANEFVKSELVFQSKYIDNTADLNFKVEVYEKRMIEDFIFYIEKMKDDIEKKKLKESLKIKK